MSESLSKGQIQDGLGVFQDAANGIKSEGDLWTPDKERVPRPLFSDIVAAAAVAGITANHGKVEVTPGRQEVLAPGIRGIARFVVGKNIMTAPAIVLRDGSSAGVLLGQSRPNEIDELTHAALENIYVTQDPAIAAHEEGGRVNPVKGGHALVAASFIGGADVHGVVHDYASANFGVAFDRGGNRSVRFGSSQWNPLSSILPLARVHMTVASEHQLLPGQDVLSTGYSASELNVAMTVAATLSRNRQFDPTQNIAGMVGA